MDHRRFTALAASIVAVAAIASESRDDESPSATESPTPTTTPTATDTPTER